jgi:hypothetical protein
LKHFPELQIPSEPGEASGFSIFDQFLFDGTLANMLYLVGRIQGQPEMAGVRSSLH